MAFPVTRLRRLRRTAELRNLVSETRLTPDAFVYPMFVCPGEGVRKEVRSMPGVCNLSVDEAVKEAQQVQRLGVPSIILFGLPDKKDEVATGAWHENGIVQQAARAIKSEVPKLILMGDVCLCEYMSHGHCGIVKAAPQSLGAAVAAPPAATTEYEIVNDASLELLARTSVSLDAAPRGRTTTAGRSANDGRWASGSHDLRSTSVLASASVKISRASGSTRRSSPGPRRPRRTVSRASIGTAPASDAAATSGRSSRSSTMLTSVNPSKGRRSLILWNASCTSSTCSVRRRRREKP
jgi:delta-aminolevulinic acid dehydratase/porphobilinogen synthase